MKLLCQIWLSLLAAGLLVAFVIIAIDEPAVLFIPAGLIALYFTVYAVTVVDRDEKW